MPFNILKLNCKAFTLVEIMVSLGIIGLVAAVSIPNLREFNKTQDIDNATSQLVNVLKNAQSSASSRIQCPSGESSTSWQVNLDTSGATDTYSLISICATQGPVTIINSTPFAATPTDQSTFQANTDVCSDQDAIIYFTNLQVSYQCENAVSPVMGNVRITLTKSGSTLTKSIVVQQGGVIRVE